MSDTDLQKLYAEAEETFLDQNRILSEWIKKLSIELEHASILETRNRKEELKHFQTLYQIPLSLKDLIMLSRSNKRNYVLTFERNNSHGEKNLFFEYYFHDRFIELTLMHLGKCTKSSGKCLNSLL